MGPVTNPTPERRNPPAVEVAAEAHGQRCTHRASSWWQQGRRAASSRLAGRVRREVARRQAGGPTGLFACKHEMTAAAIARR